MQYARLGRTGLEVSRLCLGTMTFGWSADQATAFSIMDAAVDGGINFFDTANIYSRWIDGNRGGESETIIGNWLKNKPRRSVIIATKVRGRMWDGPNGEGLSRAHIIHAVEDSLRRLQTDYIDLYQTHWFDDDTPMEETFAAFEALVQAGKVRYIGASNHPAWKLTKALWVSDANRYVRYESLQPHYSLLHRTEFESELLHLCRDQTLGVIPYSPLAGGFLTGKYRRDNPNPDTTRSGSSSIQRLLTNEQAFVVIDEVERLAQSHNVTISQIALAWLLANETVTAPIIGARTVDQLLETLGAVEVRLYPSEIDELNMLSEGF